MKRRRWREETVDAKTIAAAEALAPVVARRFYLAGGTALALRLGHRVSLDLDLFSVTDAMKGPSRANLLSVLGSRAASTVQEEKNGTCHLTLGGRSVSLFYYATPLLEATEAWRGLAVASLRDIAAMKLAAAVGRGSRKDFIDLRALADELGLDAVLAAGRARFKDHPDFIIQAGKALVYFDDAEGERAPRLLKGSDWAATKAFFLREVPKLLRGRLL